VWRQRQDFHHKAAFSPVRAHDTISHEDLQVRNKVRNHHLAESIGDAGWSAFLANLSFKAANPGRSGRAVDPAFTSQACAGCGVIAQKGVSMRWHSCPECGTSLHRNHNAAKNILWRGQRLRGLAEVPAGANREPAGLLARAECQKANSLSAYPVSADS
jgi:putative transposase